MAVSASDARPRVFVSALVGAEQEMRLSKLAKQNERSRSAEIRRAVDLYLRVSQESAAA